MTVEINGGFDWPFDEAQGPLRDRPSTRLRDHVLSALKNCSSENLIFLSAKNGRNINLLKDKLGELYTKISKSQINKPLVRSFGAASSIGITRIIVLF